MLIIKRTNNKHALVTSALAMICFASRSTIIQLLCSYNATIFAPSYFQLPSTTGDEIEEIGLGVWTKSSTYSVYAARSGWPIGFYPSVSGTAFTRVCSNSSWARGPEQGSLQWPYPNGRRAYIASQY